MSHHLIFFDIDGTLLLTGGAGQKAMEQALTDEFGVTCAFGSILTAGRTDCGIAKDLFERFNLPDTDEYRERFRQSYLSRLSHFLQPVSDGILAGVRELLDALSRRSDVHLCLLTGNYADGAWIKLQHFGLDSYFLTGGFGDHHPHRDDVARSAVVRMQQHFQSDLAGSRFCVIGDTPADIQCARAIGARAVGVATGMYSLQDLEPHSADLLFPDLSDTDAVIAALVGTA